MKHTPGPWELEQNGAAFNLKQEGMPHHMILLGMTYNPPLTHAANAKLIAAAPDLLKACGCALADLEGIMPIHEPSGERTHPAWTTIKELMQAIAKAEGR